MYGKCIQFYLMMRSLMNKLEVSAVKKKKKIKLHETTSSDNSKENPSSSMRHWIMKFETLNENHTKYRYCILVYRYTVNKSPGMITGHSMITAAGLMKCDRKVNVVCKKVKKKLYVGQVRLFAAAGGESCIAESSSNINIRVFAREQLSVLKSIPQNIMIYFTICLANQVMQLFSCLMYA